MISLQHMLSGFVRYHIFICIKNFVNFKYWRLFAHDFFQPGVFLLVVEVTAV